MKFIIAVFSATSVAEKAYQFSKAVLKQNHQIMQVFFYQTGVLNAASSLYSVNWSLLKSPLKVCRTTALENGIMEPDLQPNFEFSTLTQFFSELTQCDRYVVFAE